MKYNLISSLLMCATLGAGLTHGAERQMSVMSDDSDLYAVDTRDLNMERAVTHDVSATDGTVFRVTVVPPAGKRVDPHFFTSLRFEPIDSAPLGKQKSPAHSAEPVDVTGYTVLVDLVSKTASTSCSGYRTTGFNFYLTGGGYYQWCPSGTPESFSAAAYPKYGDVDLGILNGSSYCSTSSNDLSVMDSAGCSNSGCYTTTKMCARFVHYYMSSYPSTTFDWVVFQYLINN